MPADKSDASISGDGGDASLQNVSIYAEGKYVYRASIDMRLTPLCAMSGRIFASSRVVPQEKYSSCPCKFICGGRSFFVPANAR